MELKSTDRNVHDPFLTWINQYQLSRDVWKVNWSFYANDQNTVHHVIDEFRAF